MGQWLSYFQSLKVYKITASVEPAFNQARNIFGAEGANFKLVQSGLFLLCLQDHFNSGVYYDPRFRCH